MKKIILFAILVAGLINLTSCEKSKGKCELIAAKIIRYDCDRVIFQLLTPEHLGDSNWWDVQTGIRYENVVYYRNTCKIAALTKGGLDTLYVNVKKSYDASILTDCVQCEALSQNPPQSMVDFVEISKSPCLTAASEQ